MKDLSLDDIESIEGLPPISHSHFQTAIKSVKPSVADNEIIRYVDFQDKFGC